RPQLTGEVLVDRRARSIRRPKDAIAAGIYLVPEDRRLCGLVLDESVSDNVSLPSLNRLQFLRFVALKRVRALAESMKQRLNIRTPTVRQQVALLSGGNQQKVVLGKWLGRSPRVLLLDEPTRGVDVGAKAEIYAIVDRLANDGVAVLMISSDLE